MREQYQVTLHSQMGPREGRLSLCYEGHLIFGSLELMGHSNKIQGVLGEDGRLAISHVIQTAVSTFRCETVLELCGDHLSGLTTAEPCQMRWDGVLLSREP